MSDIVSDGEGMNDIVKDGINVLVIDLTELADDEETESQEITTINKSIFCQYLLEKHLPSSTAISGEYWL